MDKPVSKLKRVPKRKRRPAEVARREILDAARKRLMADGPDGLRLKTIAADLGLSHSSILHHFGSRGNLLEELRGSAFQALVDDLKKRMSEPAEGDDPIVDFFERVATTLGEQGYGRLLAWQLMAGNKPTQGAVGRGVLGPDGSGGLLDGLAKMLHGMRCQRSRANDQPDPDIEESRRIAVMVACTLLGEALAGDVMVRSAGLGSSPAARVSFRAWFAKRTEALVFPD